MAHTVGERAKVTSCRAEIKGIVQGVGFRPFIHNLAVKHGLAGWVCNSGRGVTVELEGPREQVAAFWREVRENPPRLAVINEVLVTDKPPAGYAAFEIIKSSSTGEREVLVSPDMALCEDCRREIFDPGDRRFRYPFTNCTNCGPRFTIIRDLPYDRERTSMRPFAMCPRCEAEYTDPWNRRFHAQPNACPACGPRVTLTGRDGEVIAGDWLARFEKLIKAGKIIAVKGIGGFHLACDARNPEAVAELRRRKRRPFKPFAVMCRDLAVVEKYCQVSQVEARWLASTEAPIIILERRPGAALPGSLAPNTDTLGVMLPYTPLHELLLGSGLEILVMTSGNASGLPLVKDNRQAFAQLGGIADFFLLHDRDIYHGCDDSLGRVTGGELHLYRRSRGFAPRPVQLSLAGTGCAVLGAGGEMKNTFCLLQGDRAFLSQHLGEMGSREGAEYYLSSLQSLQSLTGIRPQMIAYDMHPGYRVSALARQMPAKALVPVQHHHAHMAACMAENGLDRKVVGVICDGTGYGTDGRVWGFEIFRGDYIGFERVGHLACVPMPGGESAVIKPWRMSVAYLYRYLGQTGVETALSLFPELEKEIWLTAGMLGQRFNSLETSSCGRLFDAVSALLGVCRENTYEGQAAVELGALVNPSIKGCYDFAIDRGEINPAAMLEGIVRHLRAGVPVAEIATRFHNTVIEMIVRAAAGAARNSGLSDIVLSGGSFQNQYLFTGVFRGLSEKGLHVYYHRLVPANDGGLALGQAVIAARQNPAGFAVEPG